MKIGDVEIRRLSESEIINLGPIFARTLPVLVQLAEDKGIEGDPDRKTHPLLPLLQGVASKAGGVPLEEVTTWPDWEVMLRGLLILMVNEDLILRVIRKVEDFLERGIAHPKYGSA